MSALKMLKGHGITIATLAGVLAGLCLGLGLKAWGDGMWSERQAYYIGFPGKLFLNMLKCMIIPLVIPSLISSIGQLDLRTSGRVGLRAVLFYVTTTFIAVSLGIILTVTIRPGMTGTEKVVESEQANSATVDTLMDLILNCFPPNLLQATMKQYKTVLVEPTDSLVNSTIDPSDPLTWKMTSKWNNSTNILGLVVFSVICGVAISLAEEDGKPMLKLFQSISTVMMKITGWIVHLAPIGVCFLITGEILHMDNVIEELKKLGWYLMVVTMGISIQGFLILPLIYSMVTRSLPFRFMGNMLPALATAFGTASSSATLPVTINNLENGNKIDSRISRFVLPIGATINMDGTALYEAVAAIFIAQMTGMNPSIGNIVIISITATAASIGAAGIPHAGLVTLVMVLDTIGLPSEAVSIIMSVDWLVDRFRTAVNVLGDAFGAGIVAHLSMDEFDQENNSPPYIIEMEPVKDTLRKSSTEPSMFEDGKLVEGDDSIETENLIAQPAQQANSPQSYCSMACRNKSRCVEM